MCKRLIWCVVPFVVLGPAALAMAFDAGPQPELVGWWPFDEVTGVTAHDQSGNGNDGTLVNGPVWAVGITDGALQFDGVDDHVVVGTTGQPSDTFTFGAWLKTSATHELDAQAASGTVGVNNQRYAFDPRHGGDQNAGAGLSVGTNGVAVYEHGSNYMPATAAYPTDLGEDWNHILVVYVDKQPTIFLNGVAVHTGVRSTRQIVYAPIQFGGMAYGYFQGLMDDVRIYSRALTLQEVRIIMTGYTGKTAFNPQPADEAVDVPRDVVLRWDPAKAATTRDVYFGTAFDDVNDASRANPMGVLLSRGQTQTAYDPPDVLDFGTTYYWRIDEINAPPDSTIFKGDVWSFTTEPVGYPIEGIVATSNGNFEPAAGPQNTVNGSGLNADDLHSTESADMWLALPGDEPLYIQYEFDCLYKLHELLVWNYNVQFEPVLGFGLKDVTIQYSQDGADWTVLGDVEFARATATQDYAANTVVDLQGVAARFVRLTVNSGWGAMGQFGLSEVRFFYIPVQAREPQPADGAVDVDVQSALSWRGGRDAVSHEVYLGTDAEALAPAGAVSGNTYAPGALNLATTYYWQVNAMQQDESWDGAVWSFTTQEYLVVDDFESYTDDIDAGETIFDTWIDGWVNETGSTVGHLETPFAEQAIVRSGRQSMPLYYDNTAATYSETTVNVADLQVGQDWTQHGVEALTLHFYGDPDNAAQQMYVKIDGAKVPYDGDADDLKQTLWRPWSISLADSGANLRRVTELSIGFDRIGATAGTGVVYFDDIWLETTASVAGAFSVHPWTGDEDSRISSDKVYTHTGKFSGEGTDGEPFFAGNGVHFERDTNRSGTNWTLSGPATNVFDTSNPVNVTGDGAALVRGFFYGDQDGNHPVLTLTGLAPGTVYVATFYTVGYGGAGGRFTDVTPGDNPRNPTRIDQNGAGSGNGQLITYTYTATGTEMSFTFDALVTGDSWHHYAFSNEVASSN